MSRTLAAREANALGLLAGPSEQLHQHGARDVEPLGHRRAHLGVELHALPGQPLHPAADQPGGQDEQRDHDQGDDRDQPGQVEQRRQDEDQAEQVGKHAGQRGGDRLLGPDHVAVEAADQRPRLRAGEKGDRLPLHVVEHLGAQVVDEALADPGGEPADHEAEHRVEDRDGRDRAGEHDHDLFVAGQDAVVDDLPQQQGVDDGDHGVDRGGEEEYRQVHPVRPRVAGDPADCARLELLLGDGGVHPEPSHHDHVCPPVHDQGNLLGAAISSRAGRDCYQLAANSRGYPGGVPAVSRIDVAGPVPPGRGPRSP